MHVDTQFNMRWDDNFELNQNRTDCRGNLSFVTDVDEIRKEIEDWSWLHCRSYAPKSTEDITEDQVKSILQACHKHAETHCVISVAFAGELALEELEEEAAEGRTTTLDGPDTDDEGDANVDMSPEEVGELQAREQDLLDSVPLPGVRYRNLRGARNG